MRGKCALGASVETTNLENRCAVFGLDTVEERHLLDQRITFDGAIICKVW